MNDAKGDDGLSQLMEVLTRVYLTVVQEEGEPLIYGVMTFGIGDRWIAVGAERTPNMDEGDELHGIVKTSDESASHAASQVVQELLESVGLGTRTRPIEVGRSRKSGGRNDVAT